jgi:ATP-dependent phosphofructokinase / diphosphate-dependent phosphofructokinase
MANDSSTGRLGILVGGGPAPGINGVISAATIEAVNQGMEVIGFRDGYKWLAQGQSDRFVKLDIKDVSQVHLRGGSILGTARTNPTKSPDQMANVLSVFKKVGISCLVSIGGDDTAFSASHVYRQAGGAIRVAHVPKTIDNDLTLPSSARTFGFETARHLGVQILRNLAEDAKTTSRWYLIVSMGRAAGHLALGIGKAGAATLTIIPEEFKSRKVDLNELCDTIIGSIVKRRVHNRSYGVVVLAEGLIEAIEEETLIQAVAGSELGTYGKVSRDDHGHLRLGEIEFGRMIKDLLAAKLKELGLTLTLVDKDLGYELRCADPIPFDAEYTRDLGYGAVKFLRSDASAQTGAVISFVEGKLMPLPFGEMIDPKTGRMKIRRVNVDGESYECARRYMIRLEPSDLEDAGALEKLAAAVSLSPEEFKRRFARVADPRP